MKKLVILLCAITLCFALAACSEEAPKTSYQLYCEEHPDYTGTEEEWLEKINCKSAYELFCEANPDYTGTEYEWLQSILNGEWIPVTTYTITFVPDNGSDTFVQKVVHGEKIDCPEQPEKFGYAFAGWIYSNDNCDEEWSFSGYTVTDNITLTAKWEYATLELPIINIDTYGEGIYSKEDYTDMVFSIENCMDELSEVTGGIRLRGNSTMLFEKKPYRIKFDKKQSLFGLEDSKSWVLLADYLDPSSLLNYTAFTLGAEMDGLAFTATPNKVNVYLNGEYKGIYTLCEQIQENEGRMDIEMDGITEDMVDLKDYNFFICMDESCIADVGAKLDETYFYIEEYELYFELKYPERSDFPTEALFNSYLSQLKVYVKDALDTFVARDLDGIRSICNVDSLVDFLIIDVIMGEQDHAYKSFNMYYTNTSDNERENGKLNFGPIWDYDFALNHVWTGAPNENYEIIDVVMYSNLFFQAVPEIPELYELVKLRYNELAAPALENYIDNFDDLRYSMDKSLQLNQELWYDGISEDLTDKNVRYLKKYLIARKEQLDSLWAL